MVDIEIITPNDFSLEFENYISQNALGIRELKSLNNIPTYFMGKINNREANDFFSKGNNITIQYNGVNEGWSISFVDKYNYGTSIDDKNTKYKYFINENSEFVGDFIDAVKTLIGAENLKLEKKLLK